MVALGADYLLHQDDILDSGHCLLAAPSPRTILPSNNIATTSAKLPGESLSGSYPWAVGFFFGNTELSLELWTVIAGISGFDD